MITGLIVKSEGVKRTAYVIFSIGALISIAAMKRGLKRLMVLVKALSQPTKKRQNCVNTGGEIRHTEIRGDNNNATLNNDYPKENEDESKTSGKPARYVPNYREKILLKIRGRPARMIWAGLGEPAPSVRRVKPSMRD
ncbi:MAG: hypothetical protein ACQEQB_06000 [Bacteroidota bacterium]